MKKWIEKEEELQLIDIRQPREIQNNSINGQNIPLQTPLRSKHLIDKNKKSCGLLQKQPAKFDCNEEIKGQYKCS